jgi:hypothetical protein
VICWLRYALLDRNVSDADSKTAEQSMHALLPHLDAMLRGVLAGGVQQGLESFQSSSQAFMQAHCVKHTSILQNLKNGSLTCSAPAAPGRAPPDTSSRSSSRAMQL